MQPVGVRVTIREGDELLLVGKKRSGTFRQEGKVVDSLFGDTTHMPNFGMIQPLGEELPHGR